MFIRQKSGLFSLFMDDSKMENDRRIKREYHFNVLNMKFIFK